MTRQLIVAVIFASLSVGIVSGQKTDPRPQIPDTFRSADAITRNDATSIGNLKWFEVFKDEELQQLVRTAMLQNYDLRAAVARINAARANLGLARSEQFPQIYGSADLTTTRNSQNGQLGQLSSLTGGGGARSVGSFFLNLLSFELDVWGRVRAQKKAAREQLRASEEDRKAVLGVER